MAKTLQQAAANYDRARAKAERNYQAARPRMGSNYARGMTEFLGFTPGAMVSNYNEGISAGNYRYGDGATWASRLVEKARGAG